MKLMKGINYLLFRFSENNPSYGHSIEVRNSVHEWGTWSCKSWIGNVGRWTEEYCPGCQNLTINFYNNNKACGHGIGSIIHEFLHALGKYKGIFKILDNGVIIYFKIKKILMNIP